MNFLQKSAQFVGDLRQVRILEPTDIIDVEQTDMEYILKITLDQNARIVRSAHQFELVRICSKQIKTIQSFARDYFENSAVFAGNYSVKITIPK